MTPEPISSQKHHFSQDCGDCECQFGTSCHPYSRHGRRQVHWCKGWLMIESTKQWILKLFSELQNRMHIHLRWLLSVFRHLKSYDSYDHLANLLKSSPSPSPLWYLLEVTPRQEYPLKLQRKCGPTPTPPLLLAWSERSHKEELNQHDFEKFPRWLHCDVCRLQGFLQLSTRWSILGTVPWHSKQKDGAQLWLTISHITRRHTDTHRHKEKQQGNDTLTKILMYQYD